MLVESDAKNDYTHVDIIEQDSDNLILNVPSHFLYDPIPDDPSVKFFNHQTLSYGIACSFNNSHFRAERSNDPNSNLKEAVYFLKKNLINGGSILFVVTITISTILVGNM